MFTEVPTPSHWYEVRSSNLPIDLARWNPGLCYYRHWAQAVDSLAHFSEFVETAIILNYHCHIQILSRVYRMQSCLILSYLATCRIIARFVFVSVIWNLCVRYRARAVATLRSDCIKVGLLWSETGLYSSRYYIKANFQRVFDCVFHPRLLLSLIAWFWVVASYSSDDIQLAEQYEAVIRDKEWFAEGYWASIKGYLYRSKYWWENGVV